MAVGVLTKQVSGICIAITARAKAAFDGQGLAIACQNSRGLVASSCLSLILLTACQNSDTTPAIHQSGNRAGSGVSATASVSQSAATGTASATQGKTPVANTDDTNILTIYSSVPKAQLQPLLATYQRNNAIMIQVTNDEPMSILARLKAEGDKSPADLILTEDVGVFQHAVETGLVQPFSSDLAVASVPERYRDPDGNWLAMSYYARTAIYDSRVLHKNDLSSYAAFAKPTWFQKLCVSQASHLPNQALVINLINNLGASRVQETLTGWIANLAIPPVLNDTALLQAIENGKCQVGLVNSHNYMNYVATHPDTPLKLAWSNQGYGGVHVNITGVAIPKTAKNPQLALAFVEWLAQKEQQTLYASYSNTFPINGSAESSVGLKALGEFDSNPIPVRLYGERQKLANSVMTEAGYP